jgi:hypothetical protein
MMLYRFFALSTWDKDMADTARLHKTTLKQGEIQQFIYQWDETISTMSKVPHVDDLMNLFVLQFDQNLPVKHEFYFEYLFWYNRPAGDPMRTYNGLWALVHDWVRRRNEAKNRKEALQDHMPGQYAHPKDFKGTRKSGNGPKGGEQQSSSNSSQTGTAPKAQGGQAGGGTSPAPPRGKIVTDKKLLCNNYLKGKCNKPDCKLHHNGPCIFHTKGKCIKGVDCVIARNVTPATAAVVNPKATASNADKNDDKNA